MTGSDGLVGSGGRRRVVIRYRGRDVQLPVGRSIIGRSSACRVLVEEPSVSRRHARIDVGDAGVTLTDLDSANGVQLNGRSAGREPVPLRDGDVISIGGKDLLVQFRDASEAAPAEAPSNVRRIPEVTSAAADGPPSQRTMPTRIMAGADLVLKVGEQALDAGNVREAEIALRDHLLPLLRGTAGLGTEGETKRSQAASIALRLAHATGNGEWFDYVVDLLRTHEVVCSPELVDKLREALSKVDAVDARKLKSYADELRAAGGTLERLRAAQHVGDLATSATLKQR